MENGRNVEQRPEYVCLHKLVNKCSSSRVFLSDTRRGVEGRSCTCAMRALTHASGRAPAPWSWSRRGRSSRCTGSFWWTPTIRAPTGTWYHRSRWCWAGGWRLWGAKVQSGKRFTVHVRGKAGRLLLSFCSVFSEHSCDFRTVGQSRRWFLMTPDFVAACPKSWQCLRSEVVWAGRAANTGASADRWRMDSPLERGAWTPRWWPSWPEEEEKWGNGCDDIEG